MTAPISLGEHRLGNGRLRRRRLTPTEPSASREFGIDFEGSARVESRA